MHIAITAWVIAAAWRWGNWSRFNQFHATMLYMTGMNLLYLVLTKDYHLWTIEPEFGIPSAIVVGLYSFIVFPFTVLLLLSSYPVSISNQLVHILKWIIIYIGVEWIGGLFGRITYDHGWNLGYSLAFLVVMFPMLRLHYRKPAIAYIFSVFIIAFLMFYFNVPWSYPS